MGERQNKGDTKKREESPKKTSKWVPKKFPEIGLVRKTWGQKTSIANLPKQIWRGDKKTDFGKIKGQKKKTSE